MDALAGELQDEPVALARVLAGDIALAEGKPRDAITAFEAANEIVDTWIAHFDLGRAYLSAGLLIQADQEFDGCLARRGEALSLFLDDEPMGCAVLPAGQMPAGRVTVAFSALLYHSGAETETLQPETAFPYLQRYSQPRTQRTFDNLGVDNDAPFPGWDEARLPCGDRWY